MKHRAVTLRLSIGTMIVLMVSATALLVGGASYLISRTRMREDLASKLEILVTALAGSVRPDEHAALTDPTQMEGDVYRRYRALLQEVTARDERIGFIYTLRQRSDGDLEFVLDSGVGEDFSPLGTVYGERFETLDAAFEPPYGPHVDNEFTVDEFGTWLSAYAPIMHPDGTVEAVLGVDITASDIVAAERRLLLVIAAIALVTATAGAVAGISMSRSIVQPLRILADDMGRIRRLELEDLAGSQARIVEVLTMETALTNMKRGLRSFKRYVPSDVVTQLINRDTEATLGTEIRPITVFFSDLENFTAVSETMGPDLVPRLLGPYLRDITEQLQAMGATVDKFIGDAVMAFWGAPNDFPDHPLQACRAALKLQAGLESFRRHWNATGAEGLRTRIGIATGEAMVGNIGYEERLSYTAIGDTVNLAARLESLNKYFGTTLIVAESTWHELRGEIGGRMIDRVAVKGKLAASGIYEILADGPLAGTAKDLADRYPLAREAYARGEFVAAAEAFAAILADHPADGPSRLILDRCRRYAESPPANWTGVTVMQAK